VWIWNEKKGIKKRERKKREKLEGGGISIIFGTCGGFNNKLIHMKPSIKTF